MAASISRASARHPVRRRARNCAMSSVRRSSGAAASHARSERRQFHRYALPRYDVSPCHASAVSHRLEINHFVSIRDRESDVDLEALRFLAYQRLGGRQYGRAGAHRVGQAQYRGGQPVGARAPISLEHPARDKRLRKAAHRRTRQTGSLRELAVAVQIRAWTKRTQDLHSARKGAIAVALMGLILRSMRIALQFPLAGNRRFTAASMHR